MEGKQAKRWYVKFLKRLLNVAVHNAFVVYSSLNKPHHLTYILDLIKVVLTHKPQVTSPAGPGRPSINYPPERLWGDT
jgi:capsular polysaccharide biosynthesis protein